jgi:hypothetical protein
LANKLSIVAVVYGVMWLLSFWIQNLFYLTIVSGFGVVLLVVIAIGVNGLYDENDENTTHKANLELKIEKLQKDLDDLKTYQARNGSQQTDLRNNLIEKGIIKKT